VYIPYRVIFADKFVLHFAFRNSSNKEKDIITRKST